MALAAGLLFFYAVKKDWFRDIEDLKYQVFWSDLEDLVNKKPPGSTNGTESKKKQ